MSARDTWRHARTRSHGNKGPWLWRRPRGIPDRPAACTGRRAATPAVPCLVVRRAPSMLSHMGPSWGPDSLGRIWAQLAATCLCCPPTARKRYLKVHSTDCSRYIVCGAAVCLPSVCPSGACRARPGNARPNRTGQDTARHDASSARRYYHHDHDADAVRLTLQPDRRACEPDPDSKPEPEPVRRRRQNSCETFHDIYQAQERVVPLLQSQNWKQ